MFYIFSVVGIAVFTFATMAVYAVFKVSAEMDERVDQMRKARERR